MQVEVDLVGRGAPAHAPALPPAAPRHGQGEVEAHEAVHRPQQRGRAEQPLTPHAQRQAVVQAVEEGHDLRRPVAQVGGPRPLDLPAGVGIEHDLVEAQRPRARSRHEAEHRRRARLVVERQVLNRPAAPRLRDPPQLGPGEPVRAWCGGGDEALGRQHALQLGLPGDDRARQPRHQREQRDRQPRPAVGHHPHLPVERQRRAGPPAQDEAAAAGACDTRRPLRSPSARLRHAHAETSKRLTLRPRQERALRASLLRGNLKNLAPVKLPR